MTKKSYTVTLIQSALILLLLSVSDDTAIRGVNGFGVTPRARRSPLSQRLASSSLREPTATRMVMPELPINVEKYSQVPSQEPAFTATTIPAGLLKDHTTKVGTWGIIRVLQGLLEYTIDGSESFELSPSLRGIIAPQRKHHVKALSDDVEFVVEFHREINEE